MPESLHIREPEPRRRTPYVLWISIAVITIVGFLTLRYLLRDKVSVRVAHASYQNLLSTISTNGKVEPVEDFQAHSLAGGTVQKVYVIEGQQVHKNDLLLTMNADDARSRLAQANEQVKAAQLALQSLQGGGTTAEQIGLASDTATAKLQLRQAQRDYTATQQLQQSGAASADEVASAQQRLQTARNTLNTLHQRESKGFTPLDLAHAQAALGEAQAAYAAAAANMQSVEVRAPFDGTVYSVTVKAYDYVTPGDTMIEMADLSHLRVRAYFDEPEIGSLASGQSVRIVWDAKPSLVWHGQIVQVPDTVITYGTRTVGEVLISVDEDAGGQLLPNTNVTTTVTTLARQNVLAVPREALHTDGTANFVYVVSSNTLQKRAVEVGGVNLTQVEIAGGLNDGDTVALSATGNQPLSNDMHVDTIQ
jgi:HlyD family secretion protein